MKKWIQNRSLLATLLMGGLAMISLISVMAYTAAGYFLGQNDAANESRWSVDQIQNQFLEARNAESNFLMRDLKDKDFYERGQSRNLAKHEALMADMGVPEFCQPANPLDVDLLIERFNELESQSTRIRQVLKERNLASEQRADEQFTALSALLFPAREPSPTMPAAPGRHT